MGGDNPARTAQSQPPHPAQCAWAPEALVQNPKAAPVSLTSFSELGQGTMGQQGLTVSGAVVQPCLLWQLTQKCQSLKLF